MTDEDLTYKLLTGEMVKNHLGTFYFIEPGNWIDSNGYPIAEKLHRIDDPAIEYANGTKFWFLNGERHRENGPAIELPDGSKYWYLNGKLLTEEEFNQIIKQKQRESLCDRSRRLLIFDLRSTAYYAHLTHQ